MLNTCVLLDAKARLAVAYSAMNTSQAADRRHLRSLTSLQKPFAHPFRRTRFDFPLQSYRSRHRGSWPSPHDDNGGNIGALAAIFNPTPRTGCVHDCSNRQARGSRVDLYLTAITNRSQLGAPLQPSAAFTRTTCPASSFRRRHLARAGTTSSQ
ncbi:hypothetical protein BDY17DRAFT_50087 [Neohortaea acidophila]|uniref:Uncharacterized protein n=1 Tax=Neohortaea acidophila TaxID=245834 RepID=A0A6A6PIN5_9PEZI|nr:uncharacterized protein BDY17DRAFT_50087 [Neohortaea acidophila]KAF2479137.1 hypothetical protein BDY17DRAFT_50087 [Neohortaea acidophila]